MTDKRLVFLLLFVLMAVSGFAAWMLTRAHQSENLAWEHGARATAHALIQHVEPALAEGHDVEGTLRRVPALLDGVTDTPGRAAGMVLDHTGDAVLVHPPDLLQRLEPLPEAVAGLRDQARDALEGWFDLGQRNPAYVHDFGPGWTWVMLHPCSVQDSGCRRPVSWAVGGALAVCFGAALGVLLMLLSLVRGDRRSAGPIGPSGPAVSTEDDLIQQERQAVIGRLAGRFAHEFNNQLGIISNSAHLIHRRAMDAKLKLPSQVMLRAVETAGALTRRLQRLGLQSMPQPQRVELSEWMRSQEGAPAGVLGKRTALEVEAGAGPLWVHAAPGELELTLISALLSVRNGFVESVKVTLAPLRPEPADVRGLAPGCYAEIQVEMTQQCEPVPEWTSVSQYPALGLDFALRVCEEAGGGVWVKCPGGRGWTVCLVLAEVSGRTDFKDGEATAA